MDSVQGSSVRSDRQQGMSRWRCVDDSGEQVWRKPKDQGGGQTGLTETSPRGPETSPEAQRPHPKAQRPHPEAQIPHPKAQSDLTPRPRVTSPQRPHPEDQSDLTPRSRDLTPRPRDLTPRPRDLTPRPRVTSPEAQRPHPEAQSDLTPRPRVTSRVPRIHLCFLILSSRQSRDSLRPRSRGAAEPGPTGVRPLQHRAHTLQHRARTHTPTSWGRVLPGLMYPRFSLSGLLYLRFSLSGLTSRGENRSLEQEAPPLALRTEKRCRVYKPRN
ncbi:unnamed protein product [Gadus morhua 'NCC']